MRSLFGMWGVRSLFGDVGSAIAFRGCGRAIAVTIKEILEGMKR
ncbi:hypothetical protein [Sphaerospermopsis sp. LEGE 00249]|nr:hypothetical protein [Sphaerospermopsis sp. LEGE 00249]